jgi:hypothetical protein
MGWYLRKGLNFGPLRINLSKSGLGGSVGVKGFRVGTGPRGRYLHAGRGGLYYRTSLDGDDNAPRPSQEATEAGPEIQADTPETASTAAAAVGPGKNQFGMRLIRSIFGGSKPTR